MNTQPPPIHYFATVKYLRGTKNLPPRVKIQIPHRNYVITLQRDYSLNCVTQICQHFLSLSLTPHSLLPFSPTTDIYTFEPYSL